MRLRITSRAANLKYTIRDVLVVAKQYETSSDEIPLYLDIGNPIEYDWKTPEYMVEVMCGTTRK